MSLWHCVERSMNDPEVGMSRERGERAQKLFNDLVERYEAQGHSRNAAESMAERDVKEAFWREYGDKRHVFLAEAAAMRQQQQRVAASDTPNMVRQMEVLDMKHRALVRRFNGLLGAYLKQHHRDLLGRVTKKAEQVHIVNELHGIASGNPAAKELADGIRAALEDMRAMFNEAGGLIHKLDNWGLPHMHDALAVRRAGFERWFKEIEGRLDWKRIINPLTGRPLRVDPRTGAPSDDFKRSYLLAAYNNIVFSRDADTAIYGRSEGVATYRAHADARHLHFKSGQDWMDYNRAFGSGGVHESLMGHVHRMARDIAMMREFGPSPKLGAQYQKDLWEQKIKNEGKETLVENVTSDAAVALRMLDVMSGPGLAEGKFARGLATFMSTTRHVLTAALLDRAIIASLSDMNTMRMAAKAMGLNPANLIGKQIGLLPSLSKKELLRAQWVADTMADAGSAMARFQQEVAPREWAERVSHLSMRLQGLAAWTDRARATAYQEFSGFLASMADREFAALDGPIREHLRKWGVTAEDWNAFREVPFTADNGATFLMPLYFRHATTLRADLADRVFFKMQGAAEEFLELAVPTKSLLGQAFTDPVAMGLKPGSLGYEILKSGLMFKSFPITFAINQYRQIAARGGLFSAKGAGYALDLAAGATLMGALALQVGDLLLGRDPQDMTNPGFWGRAMAKGGAAGILGDIIVTGEASWGGGFASYVAGPVPQLANDVWDLTISNAWLAARQLAMGEEVDTGFIREAARFGKRYLPMGQTLMIGPALDRLFWDQLQIYLDPESLDALSAAAGRRSSLVGGGEYWATGAPLPGRMPDFANAF
jgi:hypothetical protein